MKGLCIIDTFGCLKNKEVINTLDGKALGCICDLEFNRLTGQILRIVLPGEGIGAVFSNKKRIFIPFDRIERIGDDVILVRYHEAIEAVKEE